MLMFNGGGRLPVHKILNWAQQSGGYGGREQSYCAGKHRLLAQFERSG